MKTSTFCLASAIAVLLSPFTHGQVPEYTPEQAMGLLDKEIRKVFGYPPLAA